MKRLLLPILLAGAAWFAWAQNVPAVTPPVSTAWTSATALGCPGAGCLVFATQGYNAANVTISRSGTVTDGYLTFEGSNTPDNTVTDLWFTVPCAAPTTAGTTYNFASTGTVGFQCNLVGTQRFRQRLTGTIASTGTINVATSFASYGTPPAAITVPAVTTPTVAISQTGTQNGVQVVSALPAGTNKIGALTTVDTVTAVTAITNALPAGSNDVGKFDQGAAGTAGWFNVPVLPPTTQGTLNTAFVIAPYTTNASATGNTYTAVKGSAANIYGYAVVNPNATTCWLEFYNSSAPSLGATRYWGVPILGSGGIAQMLLYPINLPTAFSIATTTTDAGGTTCSTGMGVTIYYN